MKSCPRCQELIPDNQKSCRCGYYFLRGSKSPTSINQLIGLFLIAAGLLLIIYFAFLYKTTVDVTTPGEYLPALGERLPDGHQQVNNFGLEMNRVVGVCCGIGSAIFGGILLLNRKG